MCSMFVIKSFNKSKRIIITLLMWMSYTKQVQLLEKKKKNQSLPLGGAIPICYLLYLCQLVSVSYYPLKKWLVGA